MSDRREKSERHALELIDNAPEPSAQWERPSPERETKTSIALRLIVLVLALIAAIAFYFSGGRA